MANPTDRMTYAQAVSDLAPRQAKNGSAYGTGALDGYRLVAEGTPLAAILAGNSAPTQTPQPNLAYGDWVNVTVQLLILRQNHKRAAGYAEGLMDTFRRFGGEHWPLEYLCADIAGLAHPPAPPNPPLFSGGRRPAPQQQAALPAFDPSDRGGQVYTTPPPEFDPSKVPYFMQGDFNGVTLSGDYVWLGPVAQPGSAIRMTSGPWPGLVVPFLVGANSTPPTMIMTPMLILYPRAVQDAVLTEHAWRSYKDFVVTNGAWNDAENGRSVSPADVATWAQYVQSWGFRVPLWSRQPVVGDPFFRALLDAKAVDFFVPGEEIAGKIPAEGLPPVLDRALNDCGRGVPLGIHLAPNGPLRSPADTFLSGVGAVGTWAEYNGVVHLCWEAGNLSDDPSLSDSAGTMGALLFYARRMVQLGKSGDGDFGAAAPLSYVYLWELLATSQLMGVNNGGLSVPGGRVYDERYGCLRSWELLCCPNGGPGVSGMPGGMNGMRRPDGTPVVA